MKQRAGFTLIEIIITMAVAVILLSIGIPRYNYFIQQQDVRASAQQMADCLQRAQQIVAAPQTNIPNISFVRYSVAEVDVSGSNLTCAINLYSDQLKIDSYTNYTSSKATALITQSTIPSYTSNSIKLCGATANTVATTVITSSSFIVVFGTLEEGTMAAFYSPNSSPDAIVPAFGQGINMKASLADSNTTNSCSAPLTLSVPPLAVPINLQ